MISQSSTPLPQNYKVDLKFPSIDPFQKRVNSALEEFVKNYNSIPSYSQYKPDVQEKKRLEDESTNSKKLASKFESILAEVKTKIELNKKEVYRKTFPGLSAATSENKTRGHQNYLEVISFLNTAKTEEQIFYTINLYREFKEYDGIFLLFDMLQQSKAKPDLISRLKPVIQSIRIELGVANLDEEINQLTKYSQLLESLLHTIKAGNLLRGRYSDFDSEAIPIIKASGVAGDELWGMIYKNTFKESPNFRNGEGMVRPILN